MCSCVCVSACLSVCDLPDSTTYDDVVEHLLDAQADIMRYPGAKTSIQEPTVTVTERVHVEVTGNDQEREVRGRQDKEKLHSTLE